MKPSRPQPKPSRPAPKPSRKQPKDVVRATTARRARKDREEEVVDELAGGRDVDDEVADTPLDETAEVAPSEGDLRARQFLGREFLTWLLFQAETEGARFNLPGGVGQIRFGDRLTVRALAGEATDIGLRGLDPGASLEARAGVARGGTVHEARLLFVRGDREWGFTLNAMSLDLKSVKLPEVEFEDASERLPARLAAIQELGEVLDALFRLFLKARLSESWESELVPAMGEWLHAALERAASRPRR